MASNAMREVLDREPSMFEKYFPKHPIVLPPYATDKVLKYGKPDGYNFYAYIPSDWDEWKKWGNEYSHQDLIDEYGDIIEFTKHLDGEFREDRIHHIWACFQTITHKEKGGFLGVRVAYFYH